MRAAWIPLLALGTLAIACAARPPRPAIPARPTSEVPTRPERLVLVVGESSDAIGIEQARDGEATLVALHDGTRTWVESWRVRDLELVPGARVVVRHGEQLVVATLAERVDRMAWVRAEGEPELVAIGDVVAVLRRSEVASQIEGDTPEQHEQHAQEPPPVDPARVVTVPGPAVWAVGRIAGCEGGSATVLLPEGGAPLRVPFEDVASLALVAGDRVRAPWQGSTYPATITETRRGLIHVLWEDQSDAWMPEDEIRRVLRDPPAGGRARRPAACGHPGSAVMIHLGRQRTAGVIESCAEGRAAIVRPDGARDDRALADLARAAVEPGDAIEAEWRDSGVYAATVVSIAGPTMRVRWEDGSEEDLALASLVSVLEPPRPPRPAIAPSCP